MWNPAAKKHPYGQRTTWRGDSSPYCPMSSAQKLTCQVHSLHSAINRVGVVYCFRYREVCICSSIRDDCEQIKQSWEVLEGKSHQWYGNEQTMFRTSYCPYIR